MEGTMDAGSMALSMINVGCSFTSWRMMLAWSPGLPLPLTALNVQPSRWQAT
jgi:hypothetical protein